MTGLILAFTGFLATLQNQGQTPFCTTYAVATCASVYGMKEDGLKIAQKELFLTTEGYGHRLPQLKRFNISYEYHSNTGSISEKLQNGPLLMRIPSGYYIDDILLTNGHHTCLVGETQTDWIVAGTWGTGYGIQGYQKVSKDITSSLGFQDFGSNNLTAQFIGVKAPVIPKKPNKGTLILSLITLTEKKGDSLGSGQMEKLPTINRKNTRRKYLKRLN